jgi:hypothetical protein
MAEYRPDDWFYPLNTGEQALHWRLRSIDSASSSIGLQTFIQGTCARKLGLTSNRKMPGA